jgi:hypothetical protein
MRPSPGDSGSSRPEARTSTGSRTRSPARRPPRPWGRGRAGACPRGLRRSSALRRDSAGPRLTKLKILPSLNIGRSPMGPAAGGPGTLWKVPNTPFASRRAVRIPVAGRQRRRDRGWVNGSDDRLGGKMSALIGQPVSATVAMSMGTVSATWPGPSRVVLRPAAAATLRQRWWALLCVMCSSVCCVRVARPSALRAEPDRVIPRDRGRRERVRADPRQKSNGAFPRLPTDREELQQ